MVILIITIHISPKVMGWHAAWNFRGKKELNKCILYNQMEVHVQGAKTWAKYLVLHHQEQGQVAHHHQNRWHRTDLLVICTPVHQWAIKWRTISWTTTRHTGENLSEGDIVNSKDYISRIQSTYNKFFPLIKSTSSHFSVNYNFFSFFYREC